MTEIPQRVELLKKMHLFRGLDDRQLEEVAGMLADKTYDENAVLIKQGTPGDRFIILYSGRVRVTRQRGGREQRLAEFVSGDYFGEEALLTGQPRSATVTALETTRTLELRREDFRAILRRFPTLRRNLDIALRSRRLARRMRFRWVHPDEVIYFLARRHVIELWRALIGPIFGFVLPAVAFVLAAIFSAQENSQVVTWLLLGVGVLLTAALVFLIIWRVVDWGNDYYIVTNQRVIYLEKVIGLYDSRREAPLSTILSVGVETDLLGRTLDFGDVVVRTFVGRIDFTTVGHPREAAALVEEHWKRVQRRNVDAEKEAVKAILRAKLGLPPAAGAKPATAAPPEPPRRIPYHTGLRMLLSPNIFRTRMEGGGTITYHKHLVVLLKQVWQPSLLLVLIVAGLIGRGIQLAGDPTRGVLQDTFFLVLLLPLLPLMFWWVWQYVDWSNDIFQVTGDQILDIDRTPLGTEIRRSAPLDNILSTEYKRKGFLGYLFNYGTVYITVGGTQLAFEDVYDPAAVQQDIDLRRMEARMRRQQAQDNMDRERMAEWLVAYHGAAEDLRREQERRRLPE